MTRNLTHFSTLKPLDVERLLSSLQEKLRDSFEIDRLASESTIDPNLQRITITSKDNRTSSITCPNNFTEEQVVNCFERKLIGGFSII